MKYQKLRYFLQNVGKDPASLIFEDYLTGLKNRRYLHDYLKNQIDWEALDDHPVSLLMMDIDHLKRINDQYGHAVGDQALNHVTEILKKSSGEKGIPTLYAGDEFIILMPDQDKQSALETGARLIRRINNNKFFSAEAGTEIPLTLSVGIATAPDDTTSGKGLINQAKNALFHAKQSGRNQYADAAEVSRRAVQDIDSAGIVGRKSQFAIVNDALKKLDQGISQFLIIDGVPGMGRTSFLDTVQRNLEKKKLNPVRVDGVIQESYRPYSLMSYIVMELMNRREDKGIGVLEDMDEKDVDRLAYIIPQLSDGNVQFPEDDENQRKAIFRSYILFLTALVGNRPLVMLIDDLHYSDPASLHLIRTIIRVKKILLFICGTAIEEKQVQPEAIPLGLFRSAYGEALGIQNIQLTPLTVEHIEKHVNIIFPGIDMPQRLTQELVKITEGNPLFIIEILKKMVNDKKIIQLKNEWKITRLEKKYFPKSLKEIMQTKMQELDPDSKRFLDRASVFGESISLSMLTGISNEKSAKIHDFLSKVEDQGIVRSDFKENDESIRFRSKSIREIIYEGIQPDQKKNLHEQIGTHQEKLYKHNLLPSTAFLAYHFKRSDNKEKAQEYEQFQNDHNQRIFNDQEVMHYTFDDEDFEEDLEMDGAEEIGDVPLNDESLKYVPKLLQSMLIAIRNTRLYPSESKTVINATQQFKEFIDLTLKDVERISLITEKNKIIINQEEIDVSKFQYIAQKTVDFWHRLQLKSLTFVKGFTETELKIILEKICRFEQKELTPTFWKTFIQEKKLTHVLPRQIKYKKIKTASEEKKKEDDETPEERSFEQPAEAEQKLDKIDLQNTQRVIVSFLGAYSKFKLYPASGPVAKEAIDQVFADLKVFFKRQSILTIARIESSLLLNGVKMDTSRLEAMASSLIKFFEEARLNSITFLSRITADELTAFMSVACKPLDDDSGSEFWQNIVKERQISGIELDQRLYGIMDELSGEEEGKDEAEEETESAEEFVMEEFDIATLPDRLRKLFLSGDKKSAAMLIGQFCKEYVSADEAGRKSMMEVVKAILIPEDWNPAADYMKFFLRHIMPLFENETNFEINRMATKIFAFCSEKLVLFGEYSMAAWVFSQIKKGDEGYDPLSAMDSKVVEVIIEDLKSDNTTRQQEAYQLLSTMGNKVLPLMVDVVKRESNLRVRQMIVELIKNKGAEGTNLIKKSMVGENRPEYRARILDVIDTVTTDLMLELTDSLSDNTDVVRRSAFRLAERLKSPEVIRLLIDFANSEEPELAVMAINSLGTLRAVKSIEALIHILGRSDDNGVVTAICRAMGQIGDPSCVDSLEKVLKPKRRLFFKKKYDAQVKVAAATAVSRIPGQRSASLLKSLSDDPDPRVREVLKKLQREAS